MEGADGEGGGRLGMNYKMRREYSIKYLRIITNTECNLKCYFCHKEGNLGTSRNDRLSVDEILACAQMFYSLGFRKFKLLGGEPSLRRDVPLLISRIRSFSEKIDISMVSNGCAVVEQYGLYKSAGLNRINISLHSFTASRFCSRNFGSINELKKTFYAVEFLNERGMLSKVNYVLLRNDNENELPELLKWVGDHKLTLNILNVIYGPESESALKSKRYEYSDIKELLLKYYNPVKCEVTSSLESLPMTAYTLENGAKIKFKDFKLNDNPPYKLCNSCQYFQYCIEGTRAVKLNSEGEVQLCTFYRPESTFPLVKVLREEGYSNVFAQLHVFLEDMIR